MVGDLANGRTVGALFLGYHHYRFDRNFGLSAINIYLQFSGFTYNDLYLRYMQVRSLCMLLSLYPGIKVYFVAPPVVKMRDDIKVGAISLMRDRPFFMSSCLCLTDGHRRC